MFRIVRVRHATAGPSPRLPIPDLVRSLQRSARYLRHAPPSLYITVDRPSEATEAAGAAPMRHSTRLLDSAGTYASVTAALAASSPTSPASSSPSEPPPRSAPSYLTLQSHGVYLLTSTTLCDVNFTDPSALQGTLVGLPHVRSREEALAFVSTHEPHLCHVRAVLLPAISSSGAGHAVRALQDALPHAMFYGSAFAQAFLTDSTFFDGVRRTVLANERVGPESVAFAELPARRFRCVQDEEVVGRVGGRVLTVFCARPEARPRRTHRHRPPHFVNELMFVHDSAFEAVLVGSAVCRLPWLPSVMAEAGRDVLLPAAPLLAARHTPEGASAPLLSTWRPMEEAAVLRETLRRVPSAQHVLCESFGEPATGDAEAVVDAVAAGASGLEGLRSRLAVRLETDTSRDVSGWTRPLLHRIVRELLSPHTSAQPTTDATREAFVEWALPEGSGGGGSVLGSLATALAQSALALPPSTAAAPHGAAGKALSRSDAEVGTGTSELEGAQGVALLQDLLVKKGLGGLQEVVRREEIDVAVFLAMSTEDFRRVFKATFGTAKKLELLQLELREKLRSNDKA